MRSINCRRLCPSLCLLVAVALSGCAAPKKSMIVLLPDDHNVSGEVTGSTARGSQVLNQPFQAVEIAGSQARPSEPVLLKGEAVREAFASVLCAMPAPPMHYRLYFEFACSKLLPESQLQLSEIATLIEKRAPAELSVVGHADTLGSSEFNQKLGLMRATAVAELLAEQAGAATVNIEAYSRGENDLLVKTPDETAEPRNRRVEVTIR